MTRLFPPANPPQESSSVSYPVPQHRPPRPPLPHLGLPHTPWGYGPQVEPPVVPPAALGWVMPRWGGSANDQKENDPEPPTWGSRSRPSLSSSDSHLTDDDDEDLPLHHYTQTSSSFRGGTTVNATGYVRDPLNTRHPLSTRPLLIALDSYSDVTVAHRDIVYAVRPIHERLLTGGGRPRRHRRRPLLLPDHPRSRRQPSHPSSV